MKRLYEWITKANQVLLFVLIVGIALFLLYFFYDAYQTRHVFEPPSVTIAQSAEQAEASLVEEVRLLEEYAGIYVFGIMKRMILDESAQKRLLAGSLGNEEIAYPGHMVNVVFSRAEQPVKRLLQNDGLVLSHRIAKDKFEKLNASVFLCVTEDTDGDHRLDAKDRKDLYVVSENLDRPDLVIRGGSDYWVVSPTYLAVKTMESDGIHFWEFDIESQAKREISWK